MLSRVPPDAQAVLRALLRGPDAEEWWFPAFAPAGGAERVAAQVVDEMVALVDQTGGALKEAIGAPPTAPRELRSAQESYHNARREVKWGARA